MKKRINELARELEVKPGTILDLLPELGVTEKKTHSSSLDDHIVEEIKRRLSGTAGEEYRREARRSEQAGEQSEEQVSVQVEDHEERPAPVVPPAVVAPKEVHSREQTAKEAEAPHHAPVAKPHIKPAVSAPLPAATGRGHAPSIPIPARTIPAHPSGAAQPPAQASPAPSIPVPPAAPRPAAPPPQEAARPVAPLPPKPSRPAAPAAPVAPAPPPAAPAMPRPPVQLKPEPPPAEPGKPARPSLPEAAPETPRIPVRPVFSQPAAPAPAPPAAPAVPPPVAKAQPAYPPTPRAPIPSMPVPGRAASPAPARPAAPATPRPGQILSGPRQPLPGGEAPRQPVVSQTISRPPIAPQMPRPANIISSHPRQPVAVPGAPTAAPGPAQSRPAPPMRPPQAPGMGRPGPGGQAMPARPVVPPRPEILAKLQQQIQPRATPGMPTEARPGMPRPGQPIFPGARRPGGPGGFPGAGGYPSRPGGPGRPPMRGRGMHPTAPVLEPPPLATTDARARDAGRKRGPQHGRERDNEGKLKPMYTRRQEVIELPPIDREITISDGITVKELSEKLGVKANLLIKKLVDRKIFATINQTMDTKLAEELARECGASTAKMSYEQESVQQIDLTEIDVDRELRPPIVTVMGHVDHGKTSLLDAIRSANVADGEAGGITQHIGAYQVDLSGRKIVFIDTPGHEAFTRMRARGSKVTDIVVLVVAADDGVMPQTREAIDHARAAKVPIIVAVNKIDKPDAQPERVKQQLTELGLMPEDWGGDTTFVPVSAKQKQNIDLLLEMILLVADMQEIRANPARPAIATVLEAQLDRGRGPVATILVRNGTLRVGDHYLCGSVFGKVRALYDDRGNQVREAGPSMPVELLGLESMPEVGDAVQVVTDLTKARQIAEFREQKAREIALAKTRITLEQLHKQLREGEKKELNIILKADVGGTAEVLSDTLQKLSNEKVSIRVISTGVGAIREGDVSLASASEAIIIGFNVRPERKAAESADQEGVDIRLHTIIYELTDELKKAMTGMLEPVFKEQYKGRAEIRETFRISRIGTVAGCYVQDGVISRDCQIRLLRDNVVVHTGRLASLKRFKDDAREVKQTFECGMSIENFNDLKPGDIIEAFVMEKVAPESPV